MKKWEESGITRNSTGKLKQAMFTSIFGLRWAFVKTRLKLTILGLKWRLFMKQAITSARWFLAISLLILGQFCQSSQAATIGTASWYSQETCKFNKDPKCPTASGRSLYALEKEKVLFAASNDYPLKTRLEVTNQENGKRVIVTVLDRGGFQKYGRSIDLSKQAFSRIGNPKDGLLTVKIEEVKS